MTLIAATEEPVERVLAYVNGKLVATAEPIDSLYFGENQYKNKEISVTVCDALGRQLLQEVRPIVNSQFSTLNLKEFSSGVYFATVTYGNSVTTVKLIKK